MAQRPAILLSALLVPSLAVAQITITESNDTDQFINIAECTSGTDGLSFSWTFPAFVSGSGGSYTLLASDTANCPDPTVNSSQIVKRTTVGTVAANSANGVFPATGTTGVAGLLTNLQISCNSSTTTIFFCVTLSTATTTTTSPVTAPFTLDLLTPPAPVLTTVDPGDTRLTVHWNQGSGSAVDAGAAGSPDSFVITAVAQNDPNDRHVTGRISGGPGVTSGSVGGLKNNVTYDVSVEAFSPGGNPSGASTTIPGTPVIVNDFWRIYKNDNGRETGGCATGAAGMLALLAVPLALRAWRRRS